MTYWYVLLITYVIEGDLKNFQIRYQDYHSCAVAMDEIYDAIYAKYKDSTSHCIETDVPFSSMRPRARPENLGK